MKFKQQILVLGVWMGLILSGCIKDEICKSLPERTVLVYMAADNSLSSYSYTNIADMLEGAEGDNLNDGNLLIYQDAAGELPRLYQVKKGQNGVAEKQLVKTYEESNSASVEVMRSILSEVFENDAYKAKSYGLLLWSHGTAWLPGDAQNYLRAYGQDKSNWMELNQLRDALSGYHFDFIIFDDCYMANVEVAYALRDKVDYIVASPTEVMAWGLPYARIIKPMFRSGNVEDDMTEISKMFYDFYAQEQPEYKSATTAVIKIQGIRELASATRDILYGKEDEILAFPTYQVQLMEYLQFPNHALFDFADFIRLFTDDSDAYQRFQTCLDDVVIYKATTDMAYYNTGWRTIDPDRYCGMTVYIQQPQLANLNDWYKQLDWYKAIFE
ncbi:peptidase C11 [Bacteroidia bacterium]|nr:peptidase C11 [Bacteroidia bacterium]